MRGKHEANQIARSFDRIQRLVRKAHAERPFGAQQQLDAAQAVESEIALERRVERDGSAAPRMRLGRQLLDQPQQAQRGIIRGGMAARFTV